MAPFKELSILVQDSQNFPYLVYFKPLLQFKQNYLSGTATVSYPYFWLLKVTLRHNCVERTWEPTWSYKSALTMQPDVAIVWINCNHNTVVICIYNYRVLSYLYLGEGGGGISHLKIKSLLSLSWDWLNIHWCGFKIKIQKLSITPSHLLSQIFFPCK